MRWVGNAYSILVGKPGRQIPLGRCVDGKIILKRILGRQGGCGLDASGSG
jgi:hypothetical protein